MKKYKKRHLKKIIAILLSGCVLTGVLGSCAWSGNQSYEKSRLVMDTLITLSASGVNAQKAVEESFQRLEEIENMASSTITTSDVSNINNASGSSYVQVHPEILKMIETSIEYSEQSDGAFDITIGPLINLWGIGTENQRLPSYEEIQAKLALVGYENILINENDSSVMLSKQGMAIDLGGIAKGFATDEVRKIYEKYEIRDGLIFMGSSTIYSLGHNKEGKPWAIGIANPRDLNSDNYFGVLRISDEALSTSGDYERYFIQDGKRYHHIIDPKTGYPVDNGVMSDTIVIDDSVTDNSMLSDILSTTVFALGAEEGLRLVESLSGVSCSITTTDYKVFTSKGFQTRLENLNEKYEFAN